MAVEQGSGVLTSWTTSMRSELEMGKPFSSQNCPSDVWPSAGPHLLDLPKQCHQLGTKCSYAQDMGETFLIPTTYSGNYLRVRLLSDHFKGST